MRILRGVVVSGTGVLSQRMRDVPGLLAAYERLVGWRPYPGSLNVRLAEAFRMPPGTLRLLAASYGGTVSVSLLPCRIGAIEAFVVRTDRNEAGQGAHPLTVIELVAPVRLRDALELGDGAEVEVRVADGEREADPAV